MNRSRLRSIPSVERVLQSLGTSPLPRALVVRVVREELARLRRTGETIPELNGILAAIHHRLAALQQARIQPVINATGIIIHTNLGRSLLAPAALERLTAVASQYSNLEFDLETGSRGIRSGHLESQLALLCQAQAATVVNNCAAALMLILRHFVRPERSEVIISRGELIQIGGGFRIPEILETSGARLREVGTTNRTGADDYRRAIGPETALILKVHRSNFSMDGFVSSPTTADLSAVAGRARIPLVEDLGSGALFDTAELAGLTHEPTPAESLLQGADLVCFSGDKLLGGPQAGILAGRTKPIAALKREPLFRALRCDKLVLAALEATAELYLAGQAATSVPTLAMARAPLEELRARAMRLEQQLGSLAGVEVRVGRGEAHLGGGTLPGTAIDSITLELRSQRAPVATLAARLRKGVNPVVPCLAGGWLKLNLRTVLPSQDADLIRAVIAAVNP